MANVIVLWHGEPTFKHVVFVYNEGRHWRFKENWAFRLSCFITPIFRIRKLYRGFEIGAGNHYLMIGW